MADFDRIAPVYDLLAKLAFGSTLLRAQRWTVGHGLSTAERRILFVGGGTGAMLPDILTRCPQAEIWYAETSAAMLARAQRRLQQHCPTEIHRVHFHLGPVESLPIAADRFDAFLLFFLLDLFTEAALKQLLDRLQRLGAPGARWLVADFAPPTTGWQRRLLHVLYTFFRLTAGLQTRHLPDWPAALHHARLIPQQTRRTLGGSLLMGFWA